MNWPERRMRRVVQRRMLDKPASTIGQSSPESRTPPARFELRVVLQEPEKGMPSTRHRAPHSARESLYGRATEMS